MPHLVNRHPLQRYENFPKRVGLANAASQVFVLTAPDGFQQIGRMRPRSPGLFFGISHLLGQFALLAPEHLEASGVKSKGSFYVLRTAWPCRNYD
jgi:hypothetical protein